MKVFELGYPFLWKGRKSLACRKQAKRVSYRVQTTDTQIDSGGIRWDSDGPVTQSMIASILWYGHRSTGNGFCEVTFERMWATHLHFVNKSEIKDHVLAAEARQVRIVPHVAPCPIGTRTTTSGVDSQKKAFRGARQTSLMYFTVKPLLLA